MLKDTYIDTFKLTDNKTIVVVSLEKIISKVKLLSYIKDFHKTYDWEDGNKDYWEELEDYLYKYLRVDTIIYLNNIESINVDDIL